MKISKLSRERQKKKTLKGFIVVSHSLPIMKMPKLVAFAITSTEILRVVHFSTRAEDLL